jgi:hypothetical protein
MLPGLRQSTGLSETGDGLDHRRPGRTRHHTVHSPPALCLLWRDTEIERTDLNRISVCQLLSSVDDLQVLSVLRIPGTVHPMEIQTRRL